MPKRRTRKKSLATQTFELALAAPMVMAHRMARMAMAGPSPSARDRKEFHLMGTEKLAACNESLVAMASQTMVANQQLALYFMNSFWSPWASPKLSSASVSKRLHKAGESILAKGIVPVHRRAVANAKRLGRSKQK